MRKFKEARQTHFSSANEAASSLGVSAPTIHAWEAGRKTPSIEALENMADLYGVTTDYLLGRSEAIQVDHLIANQLLAVFDGRPVWSPKYGWLLVNAKKNQLYSATGSAIPFSDAGELYTVPLPFMQTPLPAEKPLCKEEISGLHEVWVEPISREQKLRDELRGWYRVYREFVENSAGNRFYLDQYRSKWVAFDKE